jgi:hypothetical protein
MQVGWPAWLQWSFLGLLVVVSAFFFFFFFFRR